MVKDRFWYSPVYKMDNYGFFIESKDNKYYLTYKYKNGKEISVNIKPGTFKALKKEWR
jgi:hypothetical protein